MKHENLNTEETANSDLGAVSNSCLICGKDLDSETIEHGNGTCSEYCNAKYSGYPMPYDYSSGLQMLVDNCC
jgi:hypothetical protein